MTGKYSVENCRFQCITKNVYDKCGVQAPVVEHFQDNEKSGKPAKNLTEENIACYQREMFAYNASGCDCRPPCVEVTYEKDVRYNIWPQEWQLDYFAPILSEASSIPLEEVTVELLRKHLIYFSVYYGDMAETELREEEIYGPAKTLSDFGGQMGMFLGASFVSLFEIVWLICSVIHRRLTKKVSDENPRKGEI